MLPFTSDATSTSVPSHSGRPTPTEEPESVGAWSWLVGEDFDEDATFEDYEEDDFSAAELDTIYRKCREITVDRVRELLEVALEATGAGPHLVAISPDRRTVYRSVDGEWSDPYFRPEPGWIVVEGDSVDDIMNKIK